MKNIKYYCRWLVILLLVGVLLIPSTVALAATNPASEVEGGLVWGDGINGGFTKNTWYSDDRHWVIYTQYDTDNWTIMCESSADNGATWDEFVVLTDKFTVFRLLSAWYDVSTDTVHYARAGYNEFDLGDDDILYRMGTPEADGTITWATAEEEGVARAFGHVGTISICVDELDYPWVAWTEDDSSAGGVNFYPVVLPSATNNGTFTGDFGVYSNEFVNPDSGNITSYMVSIIPVSTDNLTHVSWSVCDNVTDFVGIQASLFDSTEGITGNWTATTTIVTANATGLGDALIEQTAFCTYDLGSDIWCVYSNVIGQVLVRTKTATQTWNVASPPEIIKNVTEFTIPTISGYRADGIDEDLLVIVHTIDTMWISIRDATTDTWSAWDDIWTVPDPLSDFILLHTAQYKYSSPLGFAWDWGDVSFEPDGPMPEGHLYYWWIDNDTDEPGYYPDTATPARESENAILSILPLLLVACAIILLLSLFIGGFTLQTLVIAVVLIYITIALLTGIQSSVTSVIGG